MQSRDFITAGIMTAFLSFVAVPLLLRYRHRLREPITEKPLAWKLRMIKHAALALWNATRVIAGRISGHYKKGND